MDEPALHDWTVVPTALPLLCVAQNVLEFSSATYPKLCGRTWVIRWEMQRAWCKIAVLLLQLCHCLPAAEEAACCWAPHKSGAARSTGTCSQ